MTTKIQEIAVNRPQARAARASSIDFWAVALALALSALIYVGAIKHVPW